jgi:hypothetical protein
MKNIHDIRSILLATLRIIPPVVPIVEVNKDSYLLIASHGHSCPITPTFSGAPELMVRLKRISK